MRQQLMCSVAACAIISAMNGSATAADLPVKARPAPVPVYAPSWAGFYIGGHLGWGRAKLDGIAEVGFGTVIPTPVADKPTGLVGGMHAGQNWQVNTFVYGWEADLSAAGIERTESRFTGGSQPCQPTTPDACTHTSVNLLASLRGRLGVAFDRTLLYVTGGLGYTHGTMLSSMGSGSNAFGATKYHAWGWVAGLGAEWKQNPNFSWRAEALWYGFDKSKGFQSFDSPPHLATMTIKDVFVVRGGMSYHFDGSGWGKGPVIAAAAMPLKGGPAPAPVQYANWTGFYIGGHLGWGRGSFDGIVREGDGDFPVNDKPSGLVGGMHAGQNWQVNTFVFGWEADLSAAGIDRTIFRGDCGGDEACSYTSVRWLASLRGRLGLAFDRTLLYVTGGLGYTRGTMLASFSSTAFGATKYHDWNWVAGLGAEWKQYPNFSWRVEGLWYGFDKSVRFGNHDSPPTNTATMRLKDALVVRLGATYHFDSWGKGPVVTKY